METDFSCGVIPIVFDGAERRYLLVQHHAGHWSFPKGHPEKGESPLKAARRELAEETGIGSVEVLKWPAFEERYVFRKRSGKVVAKEVVYYVGRVALPVTVRAQEKEIADFAWGDAVSTAAQMTFDEGRTLLSEVELFLSEGGGAAIGL